MIPNRSTTIGTASPIPIFAPRESSVLSEGDTVLTGSTTVGIGVWLEPGFELVLGTWLTLDWKLVEEVKLGLDWAMAKSRGLYRTSMVCQYGIIVLKSPRAEVVDTGVLVGRESRPEGIEEEKYTAIDGTVGLFQTQIPGVG
jgi:hypothetical protein